MGTIDLTAVCLESIRQISHEVADATVYLDAGCSEAFQFLGAFTLLWEIGAYAICNLESLSSSDAVIDQKSSFVGPAKKIVIITSRLLSDVHRYILRCLSIHRDVVTCAIFTSISEIAHSAYIDTPLGPDAYSEYESLLLQDYEELNRRGGFEKHGTLPHDRIDQSVVTGEREQQNTSDGSWLHFTSHDEPSDLEGSTPEVFGGTYPRSKGRSSRLVVSVQHFPLILCPLSPSVFVLPSDGAIGEACLSIHKEDSVSPGLPPIISESPSDTEEVPPGATLTANFLYHLATKMDLKLEIFSVGGLSKSIGKLLMDMSSLYDVGGRTKRSAGLLLIDRSLDLITPCCHGDSLIDRIISCLARKERRVGSHLEVPQHQNKSLLSFLKRASLDIRIPFDSIFFGDECPSSEIHWMSERIKSFISGWECNCDEPETSDFPDKNSQVTQDTLVFPDIVSMDGSFVSTVNHLGENFLETVFDKRTKDGLLLIKKWLQEALYQEKVNSSVKIRPGFPTADELHSMIKVIASSQSSLLRNSGIIQLAMAAKLALSEPHNSHWDAAASAERILSLSSEDSPTLSSQIHDLIRKSISAQHSLESRTKSSAGPLSFQDAIVLAMVGYLLAGETFATSGPGGPFSWEEENSLKETIVDAILEFPDIAKFKFLDSMVEELRAHKVKSQKSEEIQVDDTATLDFDEQWGSWDDDDDVGAAAEAGKDNDHHYGHRQLRLELRDRIEEMFKVFHKLSGIQGNSSAIKNQTARDYHLSSGSSMDGGLVYRLLSMLLRKQDVHGLEYHSSAVGRFLKSGFGRFGLGQAKPRFGDQSVLMVFVVGGFNACEVRQARQALAGSGNSHAQLLVGGTTFLTPDDMFDLLFGSCSFS